MKDKTIAILENRSGKQLADLVSKYGGIPFSAPALNEVPDIDPEKITQLIHAWEIDLPDLFIFQTGVGTKALFATTDALNLTEQLLGILERTQVLVRGPKPKGVLSSKNVRIDMLAGDPYTTAEVLAHLNGVDLQGKQVIVQRYGDTNVDLQDALQARGAIVHEVATYRWSLPVDTQPLIELIDRLQDETIDMVCFTSASQVYNLFEVAKNAARLSILEQGLNSTLIASIGPVCTAALNRYAVKVDVEPSPPKLGPFIAAINAQLA